MITIIENYKFTEYLQENKDFVRGSHATYEDGNYRYAPKVPALYIIKHIPTEKFYVGQTSELGRRLSHHFGHLRNNVHACYRIQELFNNGSESEFAFKYTVIHDNQERYDLEEFILSKYSNSELLLNTVVDGETWIHERNSEMLDGYRKKLSKAASKRVGELNSFYGKSHSEETKQRLKEANTGKENPNCWKSVVINGKYYKNLQDASEDIGIPLETVSHRVNNDNYIFCNYYEPENESDIRVIDSRLLFDPKMKTIRAVYNIEGNIYYSTDDILKDYPEIKKSAIYNRLKSSNPKFKNWKKII